VTCWVCGAADARMTTEGCGPTCPGGDVSASAVTEPTLRPEPAPDQLVEIIGAHWYMSRKWQCSCGWEPSDEQLNASPTRDRRRPHAEHVAELIRAAHPYVDADDGDVARIARARRIAGGA
jgi:hypothetical protein